MDVSKFVEWIKLSPKYLFPILIVLGFVLFAPADILDVFGLSSIVSQYRPYLGAAFLVTAALLLANMLGAWYGWIKRRYVRSKNIKRGRRRLRSLTDAEKEILRGYIHNKTRSQYLWVTDGVVRGLEAEKIIYRASEVGSLDEWAYNIQPWAWNYLNAHPELLSSS